MYVISTVAQAAIGLDTDHIGSDSADCGMANIIGELFRIRELAFLQDCIWFNSTQY